VSKTLNNLFTCRTSGFPCCKNTFYTSYLRLRSGVVWWRSYEASNREYHVSEIQQLTFQKSSCNLTAKNGRQILPK